MIALLLAASAAAGAPPIHQYTDVSLSPSGDRVAAIESVRTGEETQVPHAVIVVRSARDGQVMASLDPCPVCSYSAPAWSPDGRRLGFLSEDASSGQSTLFVVDHGKARSVATVRGAAGMPRWSPNGSMIALLVTPDARKSVGASEAGAPLVGEIGAKTDEQRIAVVASEGGPLDFVSPPDTYVYEYDWTSDGTSFVATAAKGDGDAQWWGAKLETFDRLTGSTRVLAAPDFQISYPRVSPDGATVVFIGGLMSDFDQVGGDIYTVPFAGGEPKNLSRGWTGSFSSLSWKGWRPIATALAGEEAMIVAIDATTGARDRLWSSPVSISAMDLNGQVSLDASGRTGVTVVQGFDRPPQLFGGPLRRMRPITHDNDGVEPEVTVQSVNWRSDRFIEQGWLLRPRDAAPDQLHAMVVLVHGGPSNASAPIFQHYGTVHTLIRHGFFVFEPNPRGSFGQGDAFARANIRDFGGGDFRDILAGVEAVEHVAPIDRRRLGIYGHSYGGYMAMWAATHTNQFHAAVAGAGIADWMSYYGQNGISAWMIPFFGASAYDDRAAYDRASPIFAVAASSTPTFLYVGERDIECPPEQSHEFWRALKSKNVPTSLVVYPGEGHALRKPRDVQDVAERIATWFDRYLGNAK